MLSLGRQWRQEWVFERSCGRILWLTCNPIGAAWSHPLLSSVGSIKEAIQERLAQTLTHFDRCSHTHTQAREGQSFEWVTEWETWQKWVCWKTVLPLFAGPLQKRQWSGENLWTSCSCTNVRHILFMPFPFLMYIMNLFFLDVFDEFHWLDLNPQGWWLHCCSVSSMYAFSQLPALESLNERSVEHGQWLS